MPVRLGLSAAGDSALATSTLLVDYVAAGEVTGETDVSTMELTGGGYAMLFIGASTYGFCLMPDEASASGWTQEPLPDTLSPGQLVGWPRPDDHPVVFAVGPDSGGVDLQSTTRSVTGTWSAWAPLSPGPDVPSEAISDLRIVTCGGTTDLVAVLGDGSMWRVDPSGRPWASIGTGTAQLVAGAVVSGTAGVVTVVPSQAQPTGVDLIFYPRPYPSAARTLASAVTVNTLAAAERADGKSSLIFFSDKGYLSGTVGTWLVDGADPAGGPTPIDRHTVVTNLAAADGTAATPPTLYGIGVDGGTRMWQPGLSTVDRGLFDIGWPLASLSIGADAAGAAELVGVERGTCRIRRFWQATTSADGHEPGAWAVEDIELPTQKLAPSYAHSSVFTVTDAAGNPMVDTAVDLYADDVVGVTVGPLVTVAGPRAPVTTKTDGSGRLRVTVPTETLSTRKLKIVTSGSTGGDWFTPNGRTRDRMAVVTGPELAPLVADPGQRDAVATALNRIGSADYADGKATLRSSTASNAPGWRLTIDSRGTAQVVDLDCAALEAAFAVRRASVTVGGFLDFFADIAEACVNAIETVMEWTVSTAVEGFKILVKVVIDGITWIVDTTIAVIEEGIAAAETILRVVKATLEELAGFFGWLISDAAAAIWRTKVALEKVLVDGLKQLPGLARQAETIASTYFADQIAGVEQMFDNLSHYVTGRVEPAGALTAAPGNPVTDAVGELGSILTWMWDKITSLGGGLSGEFSVAQEIIDKIENFLTTLTSDVVDVVKSALDAFAQRLQEVASSVDSLATMMLAALVEAARAVVLAVLGVADSVSHKFLELMVDILDTITSGILTRPGGDWITQGIYDAINPGTPQELTPISLVALLLAVPTTVVYRAVNGSEPFATGAPADIETEGSHLWPYLAGVAQMIPWLPIDMYLDAREPSEVSPKRLNLEYALGSLIPILLQLFLWPGGPGSTPAPSTPAERAALAAWGVGWFPPAHMLLIPVATRGRFSARSPGCVWGLAAAGAIAMAANVIAAKEATDAGTASPLDWIIAIARPLPLVLKPAKGFGGTGLVVALAADVVGDVGAGVALAMKNAPGVRP